MVGLKKHAYTLGDAISHQMRVLAGLTKHYGDDELCISHEQNVILPHVHPLDLPALCRTMRGADLATANIGLAYDITAYPDVDHCALATARTSPNAQRIDAW